MADIYVRTDGDDATGDGTTGTPYASLSKGLQSAALGTVTNILMGDGTYTETKNDAGSTVGYLSISRNRTADVTIKPELGAAGDVTIVGGGGAEVYNVLVASGATTGHHHFEYIKFAMAATGDQSCVGFHTNAIVSDFTFDHCTFTITESASAAYGLYGLAASGKTLTGIAVRNCTFAWSGVADAATYGIRLTTTAGTVSDITITDNVIPSTGCAIYVSGATGVTIQDNTLTGASAIALLLGDDAYSAAQLPTTFAAPVSGNSVTGTTTHAVMLGCAVTDIVFQNNTIYGGDIGLVAKNAISPTVRYNLVLAGPTANYAIYNKACSDGKFTDNIAIITKSGGYGFYAGADATPTPDNYYTNCEFSRNTIFAAVGAIAVGWTPTAGENGGSGCTAILNTYALCNGATLAKWDGDDKTTIAALQAAWTTYGNAAGDLGSVIASTGAMHARGSVSRRLLTPRLG